MTSGSPDPGSDDCLFIIIIHVTLFELHHNNSVIIIPIRDTLYMDIFEIHHGGVFANDKVAA